MTWGSSPDFTIIWGGVDVSRQVTGVSYTRDVIEVTSWGDLDTSFIAGDTFTLTFTLSESLGQYWEHEK